MTLRETDIEIAVRTLVEEGREHLGDPPTVDELMAYHRGELSEQEADAMQERLAHYPDSVRLLDALASYPYEGEPGHLDYISEEELDREWQTVQDQLHFPGGDVVPFPAKKPSSLLGLPQMALAASLLIAVVGGLYFQGKIIELKGQVEALGSPRVDLESRLAIPDGLRSAGESSIRLPAGSDSYHLSLSLIQAPAYPDYRLEILDARDPDSPPLWSRAGLERRHGDTFDLLLPREFLPGRKAQIRLYGVDGQDETLLATYTLEL